MPEGPEYSRPYADPDALLGIQPLITGQPGVTVSSNPEVTVRERHWLNRFKEITERVTRPRTVATGNHRFGGSEGDECWDEDEVRDDLYAFDERTLMEKFEDWEFTIRFDDYIKWITSNPGIRMEFSPDATLPIDIDHPLNILDLADRDFDAPSRVRKTEGWAALETTSVGEEQLVEEGKVPRWVPGPRHPCPPPPPPPPLTTGPASAIGTVQVIDIDSRDPLGGTVAVKGMGGSEAPKPINTGKDDRGHPQAKDGIALLGHVGTEVTLVHEPPPGYEVVGNSEKQTPPNTMHVTLTDAASIRALVFYDRRIKFDDGLPPPPVPKWLQRKMLFRFVLPLGGLLLGSLALVFFVVRPFNTEGPVVVEPGTPPSSVGNMPTIDPVSAQFVQDAFDTMYTVTVHANGAGTPTYAWLLAPPTADPTCNHFTFIGDQAVWHHGDQDSCNHNVYGAQGHPGAVTVTVRMGLWQCTAAYFGTVTGTGPATHACTRQ